MSAKLSASEMVSVIPRLKEAEFLAPDLLDPKLELLRLYRESDDEPALVETLAAVESAAAADGASLFALGEVCQELERPDDATRLFDKARALGVTAAPDETPSAASEPGEGQ